MSPQSQFVDEVVLNVRGGDDGAGAVSMRREAQVPMGGPDDHDDGSVLGALVRHGDVSDRYRLGASPQGVPVSLIGEEVASSSSHRPTFAVPAPR